MTKHQAILIENDPTFRQLVRELLIGQGIEVQEFLSAEEFLQKRPDPPLCLYFIDVKLPGIQGKDLVKMLRIRDRHSAVYLLSQEADEACLAEGLTCGADDFVLKSHNRDLIIPKLRNALARLEMLAEGQLSVGLKLIPEAELVMRDGKVLRLTNREFSIARRMIVQVGEILSREELILELKDQDITLRTIDVHVSGLRKKLETIGIEVETIRGKGYRAVLK